jgi:hypothetical protein
MEVAMAAAANPLFQWFDQAYADGTLMRPLDALSKLRANPRNFLRTYPVMIDERPGASSLITAYLVNNPSKDKTERPGRILGTLRMHQTQGFTICCNGMPQNTSLQMRAMFSAHYVEMRESTAAMQWYALAMGSDIMLTCKLSGCSFAVREQNNAVQVAHVQPRGVTGVGLQYSLAYNQPDRIIYGGLNYDTATRSATVIGVNRAGQWKIYVQKLEAGTWRILSVHRIYPPE